MIGVKREIYGTRYNFRRKDIDFCSEKIYTYDYPDEHMFASLKGGLMKDTLSIIETMINAPTKSAEEIYNEAEETAGNVSLEQTAAMLSSIALLKEQDEGWLREIANTVKEIRK